MKSVVDISLMVILLACGILIGRDIEQSVRQDQLATQKDLRAAQNDFWSDIPQQREAGSDDASQNREEVIPDETAKKDPEPKLLPLDPPQVTPDPPAVITTSPASPAVFFLGGTRYQLDSFVDMYYRRPWTYPGSIDSHLLEHGVDSGTIERLSHAEKEALHAAIHERDVVTSQNVTSRVTGNTQAPRAVRAYSNCPGGVCPSPRVTTTRRRGVFRWRR